MSQTVKGEITLKGSTGIVTEFFGYAINSILYQRGIYPPEMFSRTNKYGLTMLVSNDAKLSEYIGKILEHVKDWLMKCEVEKLVLVITGVDSGQVLERWVFNIKQQLPFDGTTTAISAVSKSEKEISAEIQAIIRQITATVTFLPLLEEPCTFDMLVHTPKSAPIPEKWEESDPRFIKNSAEVRLKSFSTKIHDIDSMVAFRKSVDI